MNRQRIVLATGSLLGLFLSACASTPPPEAAREFVDQGRDAAKRGDQVAAIALFTLAIEADPRYAPAYLERGFANVQIRLNPETAGNTRENEDRAIGDYSEAISIDPTLGQAYYNRAMLLSSRARYKQAAEDLLKAIQYRPQDPDPHLALAELYESKFEDMTAKAGEHYEKYADLGGRDPVAREKAKQFKEYKKILDSAKASGKLPTEEDEKKAEELHFRAMALIREDKREEAFKLLDELLSVYGRTRYVQDPKRLAGLKALLAAYKKDPPK
jgi:tetratricopeptide (TPR) repeat protein